MPESFQAVLDHKRKPQRSKAGRLDDVTGGKRRSEDISVAQGAAVVNNMNEKRKRLDVDLDIQPSCPIDFIKVTFRENGCDGRIQVSTMSDLFHIPTDNEIASYSQDVIQAVRERDVDQLRGYVKDGRNLQCSNRFGESLMHMACRRGFTDVVKFLVLEAKCTPFVRDDYGRTAMHDAAWSPEPNFDLMDFLIEQAPDLLLMSDVRGHTPFSYVRKEHWPMWIHFLQERREKLVSSSVKGQVFPAMT